jgi:hypothetical protein
MDETPHSAFTVLGKAGSEKAANMRLATAVDVRDVGGVKSAVATGADPDTIMFRILSSIGPCIGHLLSQAVPHRREWKVCTRLRTREWTHWHSCGSRTGR